MDHFRHIYTSRATAYHRMISAEDVEGNLLKTLQAITPLEEQTILDLGTGSGRLALLLASRARRFIGLDLHAAMLRENVVQRERVNGQWALAQSDMRALPFPTASAEVVTAGWAIGHLRGWYPADWQTQIGQVLHEMERVAKPNGALIIMETLTTGALTPAPPNAHLAEYYDWLENTWGYTRHTIATDYQFASVEEAVELTEFFFGSELAQQIRLNQWARLPEWTGVWEKRLN